MHLWFLAVVIFPPGGISGKCLACFTKQHDLLMSSNQQQGGIEIIQADLDFRGDPALNGYQKKMKAASVIDHITYRVVIGL